MSWKGTPDKIADGYALAELRAGDDLATLEREEAKRRGLPATATSWNRIGLEITRANGVEAATVKTCEWARGVSQWVLGTGGRRAAYSPTQPNKCEPGDGFAMFVAGQRVLLPVGLRPLAPPPTTLEVVKATSSSVLPRVGLFAAVVLIGRAVVRRMKGPK